MLILPLTGILTYPNSPDYRPDIDALPPLQVHLVLADTSHPLINFSRLRLWRPLSESIYLYQVHLHSL